MVRIMSLIRTIGSVLFLLSWFLIKFIVFHDRWTVSAPWVLYLFVIALVFAGVGALAMRVAEGVR